jgi:hypothetical protein
MTVTNEREKLIINACPAIIGWQNETAMRTYTQDESRNYAVLTFRGQYSILWQSVPVSYFNAVQQ